MSLEAGNILRLAKAAPFEGRLSSLRAVGISEMSSRYCLSPVFVLACTGCSVWAMANARDSDHFRLSRPQTSTLARSKWNRALLNNCESFFTRSSVTKS